MLIRQLINQIGGMGACFGMPFGIFWLARRLDGTLLKPFRSREHCLGFPNVTGRDILRVDLANELVDFMYELCIHCWKHGHTVLHREFPQ